MKPKSGNIKLFNEALSRDKKKLWKIRQNIGFLFQNPDDQLFAPTVQEDVSFGARNLGLNEDQVENRVEWALKAVNLLDYKNYSPFELSWGQKKRAALAGLLALKPKLLILDEPFANLDIISIYSHLEIFERLRKEEKMTILFTTHNLFFVENWAHKMLVLNEGTSLYEGDPLQGLKNSKVIEILGNNDDLLRLLKNR